MMKWLEKIPAILALAVGVMLLPGPTVTIGFSAGESTKAGMGQAFAEESHPVLEPGLPRPDECIEGVANGDVTMDGRPLLFKIRNNTDVINDIHYFAPGVEYYPGLGPTLYSFLGMGPAGDAYGGPVRQALNSQGLAIGWSTLDSSKSGWEVLHHQALGYYNTLGQVRTYINSMTDLTNHEYFIDKNGAAALWENLAGLDQHWEYNARAPARDSQSIDVDNADGDRNYSTGTDLNLSGWVVRANSPGHFNKDGSDDLGAGDRYRVGRDVVGSLIYNNGSGTALSAKSVATNIFRNDALTLSSSVSNIIVQGVLPTEDPGLSTMWTLLGHSETGIFVPVWLHGVESGGAPGVPKYLDYGDDGISVYTPSRGMYNAGFNQNDVQARTLPFEEHLFDVVNNMLMPDWRSRDWSNSAVSINIGQEMRRIQEQMDADAYRLLKYLYDHGAKSDYPPTVSFEAVSYNQREATFTVTASDPDNDSLTFLFNYGDGQTGSSLPHTYSHAGQYLVSYTVTDAHGVSQTDWLFITVTDSTEPTSNVSLSPSSVAENQPIDTVVGLLSITGPSAGNSFTYSLVDGIGSTDNSSFNISGNNLNSSAVFDFETKSSYAVQVGTSGVGTPYYEKAFTIMVTNLNDAPLITEGSSDSVRMDKNGSPKAFSLELHATDVDSATLTWSIASAASHGTAAVTGTGSAKSISYSPTRDYLGSDSFVVQISDGSGGIAEITVNVAISAEPLLFSIYLPMSYR